MSSFLIIVALLAINGFFVAAEFALVKARGVRIQQLALDGSGAARMTVRIQGNLEAYLAACQLGITMASLGLGWVGEPAVAALLEPMFRALGLSEELLHTIAFLIGFLLFSSLHIVVGEQVPKTWAIRRAEQVSLWAAYPLHIAFLLVWPLNWLLNISSRQILRWMGVEEATHGDIYSDAEFKELVSTSREHGVMEANKADMLHNLFDFDHRTVAQIMIPRTAVAVLDLAVSADTNREVVTRSGHSRFPLLDSREDNGLVGLVLSKTLYLAELHGDEDVWSHLDDFTLAAKVVPESRQIASLFEEMRRDRVHLAAAIDEYGSFVGIVTLEDLLEEIVGEIEDEQDELREASQIESLGGANWRADGMVSLLDLHRDIGFPDASAAEINTISGLVLKELQRFPVPGDAIDVGDFIVTVTELDGHRISKVELTCTTVVPASDAALPDDESEPE